MELLIGLIICFGLAIFMLLLPGVLIYSLVSQDYRSLRRVFRERRFGLLSVFIITAIVAVAFGVMRGAGIEFNDPGMVCIGVFGLGIGVVVVGLVWLMLSDRLERGEALKMRNKHRTPDIQIVVPPTYDEIPLAELADEDPPADHDRVAGG